MPRPVRALFFLSVALCVASLFSPDPARLVLGGVAGGVVLATIALLLLPCPRRRDGNVHQG